MRGTQRLHLQVVHIVLCHIFFRLADEQAADATAMLFRAYAHHIDFGGEGVVQLEREEPDDLTPRSRNERGQMIDILCVLDDARLHAKPVRQGAQNRLADGGLAGQRAFYCHGYYVVH